MHGPLGRTHLTAALSNIPAVAPIGTAGRDEICAMRDRGAIGRF
jgi:hypothetical protein